MKRGIFYYCFERSNVSLSRFFFRFLYNIHVKERFNKIMKDLITASLCFIAVLLPAVQKGIHNPILLES